MHRSIARATGLAVLLVGAMQAGPVGAAGFAIVEHSARGLGNAFSGGGAVAGDASTVWFNPASITRLDSQVQVSFHLISPSFEFTDHGSVLAVGAATVPLSPGGTATTDGGQDAPVPNFFYVRSLNDRLSFGLGVNAPFGLETNYDSGWNGRYQAIASRVVDVNVNPAIAYKINDILSIGVGLSANYIEAKLTNAIDFTAVCLATAGPAVPACIGTDPGQGANDGLVSSDGDDWSFGFNTGLLFELGARTRLSVAYRSQIEHDVEGRARFTLPAVINTIPAVDEAIRTAFADDEVAAGVTLPDSFSISGYRRIHERIGLMADLSWTDWSDIPELRLVFDNPATAGGPAVETLNWKSTWRGGLGLDYHAGDRLTLRTGFAYDESPTPDAKSRTARLPDNDRIWASLGGSYRWGDRLSADLGYSHLFIRDTPIQRAGSTGSVLIGTYESDADILSVQLNYVLD